MSDARIADLGYQPYDGPRLGRWRAVRSVTWQAVLRALGLRRPARAKVLPLLAAGIAYVPATVFVGLAALLPDPLIEDGGVLPRYDEYYGFISAAIVVFTALVGPEVLCPDRRSGLLGLYLAAPLTRGTYVLAKVLAVVPLLALVTLGPPLLLLIGLTLEGAGPDDVGDFLVLLLRIAASGLAVSAAYTAVSLAAASLTDRRAVASAAVLLLLLVSGAATGILVDLGAAAELYVLNLAVLPFELVQRIYGSTGEPPAAELSTWLVVVGNLAWLVAGFGVLVARYATLRVTR